MIYDIFDFLISYIPLIFFFLKYTFVIVLFIIGLLILLRLRGIYFHHRIKDPGNSNKVMNNLRLVLGCTYMILAFGILFNYLTYFLIWLCQDFNGLLLIFLNYVVSTLPIEISKYLINIEYYIYPIIALCSFFSILQYVMSIFYLVNNNRVISSPKKTVILLASSLFQIIGFGFACLPYLL
ncbi:MAG: hypothetical protein ACTSPN_01400 [Promethearchaeota archaeon]